jgi:hypothetical protein
MSTLSPHRRGDTFSYSVTLGGDWVFADFTGGMKFTLRRHVPASSVTTDDDATDQATTDDDEITGSGATVTIVIPASRTTSWPAGKLYWDLQGVVTGTPDEVYTIDSGTISIEADITRSA